MRTHRFVNDLARFIHSAWSEIIRAHFENDAVHAPESPYRILADDDSKKERNDTPVRAQAEVPQNDELDARGNKQA